MKAPLQTQTEDFAGGRLATSAQPPRATAAFSRHASSQHAPQPIRSLVTLDTPGVSGGDGLEVRRLARGIEMLANALLFRIVTAARFSMCSRSHDASSLRRVFHEREIALGDLPL